MMGVDALEELVGWPNNGNTFLASGPDGMRLAVAPADVGGEIGMMAAFDWAYAKYGAAFTGSAEPVWRLRRWHGCRTTGFADWIGDAEKFLECGRSSCSTVAGTSWMKSDWGTGRITNPKEKQPEGGTTTWFNLSSHSSSSSRPPFWQVRCPE